MTKNERIREKYGLWKPFYDPDYTLLKKKYSVLVIKDSKLHLIHFGDRNGKIFKDKIGRYKSLEHNDPQIRDAWKARHQAIRLKDGSFAYKDKTQPEYYSWNFLW